MKVRHEDLRKWVRQMANLCQPDKVVWLNGSLREKETLEKKAVTSKELIKLDQKKLPGCFYHRSHPALALPERARPATAACVYSG
jgi:phosphoenolpyruvate carboxykinase (GTP)